MPSAFGAPIRPKRYACTAELPVCLHEERPGCVVRWPQMVVPSLAFRRVGVKAAGEQGGGG